MLGSRRSGYADEETFLLSNVVISMDVARAQTKRVGTGRLPLQAQRAFVFGSRSDEAACPRPRRNRFLRCSSNACALRLNRTQAQQALMETDRWWIGRLFGVESQEPRAKSLRLQFEDRGGIAPFSARNLTLMSKYGCLENSEPISCWQYNETTLCEAYYSL